VLTKIWNLLADLKNPKGEFNQPGSGNMHDATAKNMDRVWVL
jgi:hypothetical protein